MWLPTKPVAPVMKTVFTDASEPAGRERARAADGCPSLTVQFANSRLSSGYNGWRRRTPA